MEIFGWIGIYILCVFYARWINMLTYKHANSIISPVIWIIPVVNVCFMTIAGIMGIFIYINRTTFTFNNSFLRWFRGDNWDDTY